jgi:hypothetical protein
VNKPDVETAQTEELIPYANNPKEHPEEQVDNIAASINEYGFVQPLVVDEDNTVIIGHGRLKAAKKLGLDQVPIIRAEHLSKGQIKALRIADNKVAESEWDYERLTAEFEQFDDVDTEADMTFFDEDEREEIFDRFEQPDDDEWADYFEEENEDDDDDEEDKKHVTFVLDETHHDLLMNELDRYEGDKNESFTTWLQEHST